MGDPTVPPAVYGTRMVVSLYREFAQVARGGDLSMAQYRTLLYLINGPRRAGELAAANAVTKPTVSAMINGLRDQGWVADVIDDTDGRVTKIVLTPAGIERVEQFEAALAERLEASMPSLSAAERDGALAILYESHHQTTEERLANVFGQPPV